MNVLTAYRYRGLWMFLPLCVLLITRFYARAEIHFWGLLPVTVSCLLRLWAGAHVGAHSNGDQPEAPNLVQSGPYALMRHPLYAANFLAALGCIGWANSLPLPWVGILLAGIAFFYGLLARSEDAVLLRLHGLDFARYRERVGAFGFRWKSKSGLNLNASPKVSQALARPDWSGAWRRQGRNIAYALAVPLLLCLAKTLGS